MTENVRQEIEQLREEIWRHNRLYYVDAQPEITDLEYDKLLKRLERLEADHPEFDSPESPSHKVGGEPIEGFETVAHRQPMLSIDNVYNEDALLEFDARLKKLVDGEPIEYTVEYKIDGVALALVYEQGVLTQALTRGDGRQGDDITNNARTIRGVPLRLHTADPPAVLEIRGESLISNSDFASLRAEQESRGEKLFANPRNATAGALKLLDPKICAARKIRFLAHGTGCFEGISFETHTGFLSTIQKMGMPVTPNVRAFGDIQQARDYALVLGEAIHSLDFEVDGIVIKVNQFTQREQLGNTTKSPRWVIAFKWEKYEGITQVEDIQIQVGKTGALTPVAYLKPVEIAGTTVSRASLHNRDEIERLGIRVGDWVVVEKAGKIIPHVVRVEEHRRDGNEKGFSFPEKCPECETPAIQDKGGVYVRCPNPNCPAQLREAVRFFASRTALDIEGLGIKLVEQLTGAGLVARLTDIYELKTRRDELLQLERMGEKSVDKLIAGIEKAKQQPLWRLLTGLNIRHVGTRSAQILAEHFGTIGALMEASEDEIADVHEIGPIIAESVFRFLYSDIGREIIADLKVTGQNLGLPVEHSEQKENAGILDGQTIVVTGTLMKFTRDEIKELIRQHGGRASGSISSKTNFLVAGEKAGSKLARAEELDVPIYSEQEFLELIEGKRAAN